MPRNSICRVQGCENKAHAKGYCRKHYGQIWRRGKIVSDDEGAEEIEIEAGPRDETDRMRALERELRRAEMMYSHVVGFEGRLKWRREIDEVKAEMKRLGMIPEEQEAPAASV